MRQFVYLYLKPDTRDLQEVDKQYAMVVGIFDANNKGHRGLWSGSVRNIEKLVPHYWQIKDRPQSLRDALNYSIFDILIVVDAISPCLDRPTLTPRVLFAMV